MSAEIRLVAWNDPLIAPMAHQDLEASSKVWVGLWDGEVAIVWGIVPASILSDHAYVWSVGTPVLRRCRKTFLKWTRLFLEELQQEYPVLTGLCERKTAWLDHLGAVYSPRFPAGFYTFEIRAR